MLTFVAVLRYPTLPPPQVQRLVPVGGGSPPAGVSRSGAMIGRRGPSVALVATYVSVLPDVVVALCVIAYYMLVCWFLPCALPL